MADAPRLRRRRRAHRAVAPARGVLAAGLRRPRPRRPAAGRRRLEGPLEAWLRRRPRPVRSDDDLDEGPDPAGLPHRHRAVLGRPGPVPRARAAERRTPARPRRRLGAVRGAPRRVALRRRAACRSWPSARSAARWPASPASAARSCSRRSPSASRWRSPPRSSADGCPPAIALVASLLVVGVAGVAPRGEDTGRTVSMALVQGGGPQGTRAIDTDMRRVFERHLEASEDVPEGLDLIVWPEDVVDTRRPGPGLPRGRGARGPGPPARHHPHRRHGRGRRRGALPQLVPGAQTPTASGPTATRRSTGCRSASTSRSGRSSSRWPRPG